MKKRFICLANSKKYTQRCIAGIELVKSTRRGYKYDIVRENNNPVWIRPVSSSEYGEVSDYFVKHINLLDVVAVNVTTAHPQGYQAENVLFDNRPLRVVDKIDQSQALLDKLLTVDKSVLFGNSEKAIRTAEVAQLDYSLALIKPVDVQLYETTTSSGTPQVRGNFVFKDIPYDLPVTDIDFSARFRVDSTVVDDCTHFYFTVSLGADFEGWHYKLIAGVVYF